MESYSTDSETNRVFYYTSPIMHVYEDENYLFIDVKVTSLVLY